MVLFDSVCAESKSAVIAVSIDIVLPKTLKPFPARAIEPVWNSVHLAAVEL